MNTYTLFVPTSQSFLRVHVDDMFEKAYPLRHELSTCMMLAIVCLVIKFILTIFYYCLHWYELLMVKTIKGWLVTSQLYSSG